MSALEFWPVVQTFALVTAGFGVWILARACWEYAGIPAVRDGYLELVADRLDELEHPAAAVPSGGKAPGLAATVMRSGYARTRIPTRASSDAAFRRQIGRAMAARPSPDERSASQAALLRLLGRPELALDQQDLAARTLAPLREQTTAAGSVRELARTARLLRQAVIGMLRNGVPSRFRAVFLPGMARYLDFVGRGSSLGLAAGVLLTGGLTANAELVGALTTLCGVGGAIIFTLIVIRCEARSWPAGQGGVWLRLARRFPQLFFLLRLALTTAALLLALYLVRS